MKSENCSLTYAANTIPLLSGVDLWKQKLRLFVGLRKILFPKSIQNLIFNLETGPRFILINTKLNLSITKHFIT